MSIGETAAEVSRRGGRGVPVRVDHARDAEVRALFDEVDRAEGRRSAGGELDAAPVVRP